MENLFWIIRIETSQNIALKSPHAFCFKKDVFIDGHSVLKSRTFSNSERQNFCNTFIANWLEAKTIIFRNFLARYRNFLPQVDQKVHQVIQNLPQAFCIGDVIRYAEKKL